MYCNNRNGAVLVFGITPLVRGVSGSKFLVFSGLDFV